jgi:DNA-binding winged helix-turn-helix (wHTH) protein/TolB-like protein
MQKLSHQIHSFGEFSLDLTRGCLMRGQREIKLRPKAFEVLTYLIKNNGRLVGKDELIHAVWVDTAVTDDSLVQCLMEVRRALGDEAQQIIKTVARRGYIFDVDVSENGSSLRPTTYKEETAGIQIIIEEQRDTPERPEIAGQTPPLIMAGKVAIVRRLTNTIWRHKIATAVALVLVVVAMIALARPFLAWWFKPPSIAILRIVNATGDPNNDYISDGLTESIIRSLAQLNEPGQIPRLLVTAQNTVFAYKDREARSVGRELGVDTVLASQMTEQDGLWFIKVEMINVGNGSEMWSKQYSFENRRSAEFPKLQDDIAREVAAKLPLRLNSEEQQRLTRRSTQNPEAYEAFLKSRAAFLKATPTGFSQSIEYGQQAIDLDPDFALAYWSMGTAYALRGVIGAMPTKDANDRAIELYLKSLKIDNTLRPTQNGLQLTQLSAWDWEAIEKAAPRHAGYSFPNGGYLITMGRLDEQLAFENRILSLDPHNPFMNYSHANTLFLARQYDAAIMQLQKTLNLGLFEGKPNLGPESPWIHYTLGHVYTQKGMFTEAFAEFNHTKELLEDSPLAWEGLAYAYAKSGQRDEALKILGQLQIRTNHGEYVWPLGVACTYIGLGDNDQAFVWLDKAFAERSDALRQIKTNPIYDPLRADARFTQLLKRMRLPT